MRMMILPLIIFLKCKLDNNSLLVGEVSLEGGLEAGNGARRGGGENE
jgi:hypothetical protein